MPSRDLKDDMDHFTDVLKAIGTGAAHVRRNTDLVGWDLPEEDAIEDDYIEGVDDIDP